MKCLACGREMIDRENYWECSNLLCDYEEEAIFQGTPVKEQQMLHIVFLCEPVYSFSFVDV